MRKDYTEEKWEHQLNQGSLEASAEIAAGAKRLMFKNHKLSYEEAAELYMKENPELVENYHAHPESDSKEPEAAHITSLEASKIIADKANELMFEKNCTYDQAVNRVFADPANAAICKAYKLNS